MFPWFIPSKQTIKVQIWHYLTFPSVFESSKGKLTETFQTKLLLKSVWKQFYYRYWKIWKIFRQILDLSCENMNMRWWEDIDIRASNFSSSSLYENFLADPLILALICTDYSVFHDVSLLRYECWPVSPLFPQTHHHPWNLDCFKTITFSFPLSNDCFYWIK